MEQLVDEDARELGHRAIESDPPLAKKGGGMDRPAAIPKARNALEPDGAASEFGQAVLYRASAALQRGVVGNEERRHS